ncbi:zinc knuckle family protein [Musa troglodytarum]|uniref:Zinc knuckle family protein n=1 Tax=Musa troglodytarum TaxID=320322 RepID=A0A9E7GII2_9LILI|nr:zinc knuckle family protein [Musa troglodytarum]
MLLTSKDFFGCSACKGIQVQKDYWFHGNHPISFVVEVLGSIVQESDCICNTWLHTFQIPKEIHLLWIGRIISLAYELEMFLAGRLVFVDALLDIQSRIPTGTTKIPN